jgi:hypothetical protein
MVDTQRLYRSSIVVNNHNVVIRMVIVMHVVVMLVDNFGWFVSDNYFVSTYHGCEC